MQSINSIVALRISKNAFDLVPPDILWNVFKRRGMAGRVLTLLQSMYAADKACVFTRTWAF